MWLPGQGWRVTNSLNVLNQQIRVYAPRSVPPATPTSSWGALADDEHSVNSDHYPHYYSALGSTAVVCARDFPHAPSLGLDGGVVTNWLVAHRDPRLRYIIFNRRIAEASNNWQWRSYSGDDPHDTHFHVSGVHTGIADNTAPFSLPGSVAPITTGVGMEIFTITQCPAGGVDAAGTPLTEGGQYFITPKGVFSLTGNEFFSQPAAIQPNRMAMIYPRAVMLASALAGDTATPEEIAAAVAAQFPNASITQQVVLDAINSPEGQAALVRANETSEDS